MTSKIINTPDPLKESVSLFLRQSPEQRGKTLAWVREAANGHPVKETRHFNAALYPLLIEADMKLRNQERPEMPTREETVQFFGNLGAGASVFLLKLCGTLLVCGIAVSVLLGLFDAIRGFMWENRKILGFVIMAGMAALFGAWAWGGEDEGQEESETPTSVQNQTIIVNVFTSQNGNVDVKN